jgi:hypothetical protein
MLDLRQRFGAQLRCHFENLFRAIVVTKNLNDFIAVSVARDDTVF